MTAHLNRSDKENCSGRLLGWKYLDSKTYEAQDLMLY